MEYKSFEKYTFLQPEPHGYIHVYMTVHFISICNLQNVTIADLMHNL